MKKLLLTLSIISVFILAGCKGDKVNSIWNNGNIKINGNDSDWRNTLTYVKDSKFLFGIQNDNKNLYLCLVTNDPELENKIIRMGFTVWLDREGSDRQVFGIKYPLSFQDLGRPSFNRPPGGMEGRPMDRNQIDDRMLKRQTDIEILGKNKNDVTRIPVSELKGIKVKVDVKDYRMVYEMKIPLHSSNDAPYAINADTGSTISVGLATGTIDRSKFEKREGFSGRRQRPEGGEGTEGGEYPEGGMREPREGGEGGYRMNRNRSNGGNSMEPLEYWTEVKLATQSQK